MTLLAICEKLTEVRVLFNNLNPFMLSPGGAQVNMEQTMAELTKLGVDNAPLEWWNSRQTGDILHHFGHLPLWLARMARDHGWKVVVTLLLTQQCNRSKGSLLFRRILIRSALDGPLPRFLKEELPWYAYREYDKVVVGLEIERSIVEKSYGVRKECIVVVPSGTSDIFLKAGPGARVDNHLVSHGRIGPTKRSLELAKLARAANVPVLFIGRSQGTDPGYWRQFRELVDDKCVKHLDNVASEADLISLLQRARGYVLMSRFENWCLAAHEAAACGLPVLIPDQPWARERFGDEARYLPASNGTGAAAALRKFYEESPRLPPPKVQQYSWADVARQLKQVYQDLLSTSR